MEDTREELNRLEQELLSQEQNDDNELLDELIREVKEESADDDIFLDDALLREVLPEDATPAFEDPDKIHEPEELIYSNYANDYGKDLEDEAQEQKAHEDKLQIILMIAASALSLGIIGILIYWLVAFF